MLFSRRRPTRKRDSTNNSFGMFTITRRLSIESSPNVFLSLGSGRGFLADPCFRHFLAVDFVPKHTIRWGLSAEMLGHFRPTITSRTAQSCSNPFHLLIKLPGVLVFRDKNGDDVNMSYFAIHVIDDVNFVSASRGIILAEIPERPWSKIA